jgi:hypothetical protein
MSDALPPSAPPPVRRSRFLPGLLLVILIFAGGAGFWAWASQNWFQMASPTQQLSQPSDNAASEIALPPVGVRPGNEAGVDDVTSLSERIRALESGSSGSANAGSSVSMAVERLVLILATRKAAERGTPHVPIARALSQLFPAQQGTLLPAILQNAANPVGLAELAQEFDALKNMLSGATGSWLDQISRLAVIRSRAVENPSAAELLEQAEIALQREDIALATRLIAQHPARAEASVWLARANAYAAGVRALDSLEALALETPVPPPTPPAAEQPIDPPSADDQTPSATEGDM